MLYEYIYKEIHFILHSYSFNIINNYWKFQVQKGSKQFTKIIANVEPNFDDFRDDTHYFIFCNTTCFKIVNLAFFKRSVFKKDESVLLNLAYSHTYHIKQYFKQREKIEIKTSCRRNQTIQTTVHITLH